MSTLDADAGMAAETQAAPLPPPGPRPRCIYVFTQHYPATYKPYFDTQFAQFLRDGHDVRVFANARLGKMLNGTVSHFRLHERTRYWPGVLRQVPRHLFSVVRAGVLHPGEAARRIRMAAALGPSPKNALISATRMLQLPLEPPDLCLVHDLTTAVHFPWLRQLYPGVPVALYYHGGEHAAGMPIPAEDARAAFEVGDAVFTNTRFSADHAIARGCPPEKLEIVPVGFWLAKYVPSDNWSFMQDGVLRILTAGRMSEEKGQIFALRAVRMLVEGGVRNIRYSLTGDGYLRPVLERFVEEHGLEQYVEFLGMLTTEQVIERIGASDLILVPSIQVGSWVENQACIVQEGMLMKKVVVATHTGGIPESISPGLSRLLVPPEDPGRLAGAIREVLALPQVEIARLGEEGRAFATARYDVRLLNDRILKRMLG